MGVLPGFQMTSHSPEETWEVGQRLGELAQPGDVVLLSGVLGAGKTCLVQGLAWGLGIKEYAASPSFIIVRELYGRLPLYHIDLYRLENLAEIEELGLDGYLCGRGVSAVEWAERAWHLLPPEHLRIDISYLSDNERSLKFEPHGKRYEGLLQRLKDLLNTSPLRGEARACPERSEG